jgi:predicted cobalt transporter CbtA
VRDIGEENTAMIPRRSLVPKWGASEAKAARLVDRLLWLCVPIGIVALLIILLLFGLSLWSALAIAFLIVCPLVIVWALVAERGPLGSGRDRSI